MNTFRGLLTALLLCLASAGGLAAQEETAAPLEPFIQQVARMWSGGDAAGLVSLVAADGQLVLDTGRGTETVNSRHAAAALRALFGDQESVSARPVRITYAGGRPWRGFGELAWAFRARGAPAPQTRSIYVGAVWEGEAWRIRELRVLP